MAFPRWPGDGRVPSAAADTYFTAQALRAGYPVDPIARPDLAAPPSFSAREVLQWEMQEERIREEYLSRELVHSRLLLDQQMRHQQEIEAAHRVVPAPAYPSLVPEFRAVGRLPVLAPHPVELGFRESLRPPVPGFVDAGIHRRPGPRSKPAVRRRHSAALRPESVIRKQRPVGQGAAREHESKLLKKASGIKMKSSTIEAASDPPSQVLSGSQSKLLKKASGIKRKAATIEAASDPPSQDKSEWTCSICQVFATSEHDLKVHLNGRRHKVKQESLYLNGRRHKVKQESLFCDVCKVRCTSQTMLDSHLNGKRHKEASVILSAKETCTSKEVIAPLPVKEQKQEVQKSSLNCDVCNLKCNSEFVLNEHLNGKKHMRHIKAQGDKPVSAESNKLANDKQPGNALDGEPVIAEGLQLANDKPVTAEQIGEDKSRVTADSSGQGGKSVTAEQIGEDKSRVTADSSGQGGKSVTAEQTGEDKSRVTTDSSGQDGKPVTAAKHRAVKKARRQVAVGNVAVKTGPADTEVSVVGSVAAETTEVDYHAMSTTTKEVIYLKLLPYNFSVHIQSPMPL